MTQQFREDGTVVAVTKVQAGPCTVAQVKTAERDGYNAIQFGYGTRKPKNVRKPQQGHLKGLATFAKLRELRLPQTETAAAERGQCVDVSSFVPGDKVHVTGTSKGRGFQGVVKRWGFSGSLKTHGHKDQHRMPGSIGSTGPAHVFKGTRMGGHMGDATTTVQNLEVIAVDAPNNILYIKGAIPGARNGWLVIKGEGEMEYKEMQNVERKMQNEKKEENLEEVKKDAEAEGQGEEKAEESQDEAIEKPQEETTEEKTNEEAVKADAQTEEPKKEEAAEATSEQPQEESKETKETK